MKRQLDQTSFGLSQQNGHEKITMRSNDNSTPIYQNINSTNQKLNASKKLNKNRLREFRNGMNGEKLPLECVNQEKMSRASWWASWLD